MKILGTRIVRDVLDHQKRKFLPVAEVEDISFIPLRDVLDRESLMIIQATATRLNPLQQQILEFWLTGGYSIPEMAKILAISESSVKRERAEIKIALEEAFK